MSNIKSEAFNMVHQAQGTLCGDTLYPTVQNAALVSKKSDLSLE